MYTGSKLVQACPSLDMILSKKVNNKDPLLFANPEDRFSHTEAHIIVRESVQHYHYYHAGLIARKPVFRVSEEVKLQPVCSATETS